MMGPNVLTWGDLQASLTLGWQDFRRAPFLGLFFAGVYVLGGWILLLAFTESGRLWWSLPAMAGFPILGPFIACGFYDISRRLEAGEPLSWWGVMGVIFQQRNRQIPSMAAIIVVFFLFWNFLAHMIFALFLGFSTMTNVSSSFGVFLTPNGLTMLATGTVIGAVFAATLFSLTVISLPLLLDREVDFVTAMIASVGVVSTNPMVMLGWAALIAVALFAAMLPGFLGLFLVLPLFGHATWHLYRRALDSAE
jgi:uncharacterized membrane protein